MIVYTILGVIIGGIVAWFISFFRLQKKYAEQIARIQASYLSQCTELEKKAGGSEARI